MKKHEFRPGELTDKAFNYYSGTDETFYMGENGHFYTSGGGGVWEDLGDLQEVNEKFEELYDEWQKMLEEEREEEEN